MLPLTRMPHMRALVAEKHGGPDVLKTVQRDPPAPRRFIHTL